MFKSKLNMTQASFEAPESNSKKRKRHRETLSCLPCRDRKVACNREQPCSSCIRHKRTQDCVFVSEPIRKDSTGSNNGAASGTEQPHHDAHSRQLTRKETLDERITRMEKAVGAIDQARSRVIPAVDGTADSHGKVSFNVPDSSTAVDLQPPIRNNIFAQGRLASKTSRATYYVGSAAWTIPSPYNAFFEHEKVEQQLWGHLRRLHWVTKQLKSQTVQHETIMSVGDPSHIDDTPILNALPGDDECLVLVQRFLDSVNQIFPVVPRASFVRELHQFFADRSAASEAWVALLTAIIAVGYDISIHPLPNGTYNPDRDRLYQLTRMAQNATFAAAAKTHRPPLTVFQALLAVIIAKRFHFHWIDSNDGLSGLLGVAQRLAFSIGLHRDPRLAKQSFEAEDSLLREKVFSTYLLLEFHHSLECGHPFLLRPSDFDVRNPGGLSSPKDRHLSEFMKIFPTLATGLQFTHSNNYKPHTSEITQILQSFIAAADRLAVRPGTQETTVVSIIEMIQSSIVPTLVNRLHVAMLNIIMEHGAPDFRQRVTNDMYKPAFAIIDLMDTLMNIVNKIPVAEVRSGLQKIVFMTMRSSLYNACAYLLLFLKLSLSDTTLLNLRGPTSAALDSSFVLRKLRTMAEWSTCGFTWSFQLIKEGGGFNAYLHAVQALYRIYVETGTCDLDILSADGVKVIEAMAKGIEETYERAGYTLGPGDQPVVAIPENLRGSTSSVQESPTSFLNELDPLFFENWDWPWTDLIAGSESSWSTPATHDKVDNQFDWYENRLGSGQGGGEDV
ncbi:hypothetical protein K461DRAFT_317207 [Myriangium duriaei CBS 260.36]|uniref:Zn(2)-C6 fungal-type domain-containing protein n=1 Tax=Myriangium duriaei CBS 260.36 TaxID=1168546 RepID=A0A9P4JCC1_9PEZI|nr:hypothetical protein K461DRAFT_317207 [Myriangium duriaei CBS 260.36]